MSDPFALVVGEALVDVVTQPSGEQTTLPGGSAANAAVALARLGRPVHLATQLGDDDNGRLVSEHLGRAGVVLTNGPVLGRRTSSATAQLVADGSAGYEFDFDWSIPVPRIASSPAVVYTTSLGAVTSPGCESVVATIDAFKGSALVFYDVNARPTVTGTGAHVRRAVARVAQLADVVKASDEDLAALYPDRSIDEAVQRLLLAGAGAVVVTLGADGSVWYDADRIVRTDAVLVDVVDTIGAGDTFGAALVDYLMREDFFGLRLRADSAALDDSFFEHALAWSSTAAAITCSRRAADPPTRSEVTRELCVAVPFGAQVGERTTRPTRPR